MSAASSEYTSMSAAVIVITTTLYHIIHFVCTVYSVYSRLWITPKNSIFCPKVWEPKSAETCVRVFSEKFIKSPLVRTYCSCSYTQNLDYRLYGTSFLSHFHCTYTAILRSCYVEGAWSDYKHSTTDIIPMKKLWIIDNWQYDTIARVMAGVESTSPLKLFFS